MTLKEAADALGVTPSAPTPKYEAYHCRPCGDTGLRVNESANIVDPRRKIPCFCDGAGVVLVLAGYPPRWYAGDRWPERDL